MSVNGVTIQRRQLIIEVLVFLGILAVLLAEFWLMQGSKKLSDESFNFRQITRFLRGDFSLEPEMNVIPGYHALVAFVMYVINKSGLFSARLVSTGISFLSVVIFHLLVVKVHGQQGLKRTLQYAFFPLFFPFFPLVYTDILAMLLILLAFYLLLCRRFTLSGLAGIFSLLVRQNNISWFVFLFVWMFSQEYGFDWRRFLKDCKRTWIYWLGLALFLIFVLANRGIALTNKEVQPLFKFQSGNIFFLLFLSFFLFLPLIVAKLGKMVEYMRGRFWVPLVLLLAFGIYLLTFQSTHPYNQAEPDYYLRNRLLMAVTAEMGLKLLFFVPVGFAFYWFIVTRLEEKRDYWLYPFTIVSLVPFWLIEPRYSFVPLSLFLLMREEYSSRLEWMMAGFYAICAIVLFVATRGGRFFI